MQELSAVNIVQITYLFALLMLLVTRITGTIKTVARYKYVSSKFVGDRENIEIGKEIERS